MNIENKKILTNIIGAVETGGQIYGNRRYASYVAPYTNSPKEHTISLGWPGYYGNEAQRLIQLIHDSDISLFRKLDKAKIESMLSQNWVAIKWNPNEKQKKVLISLIDSEVGHICQDNMFIEHLDVMIEECAKLYTDYVKAQMMYCEIRHLGGASAAKRIFDRCKRFYSLDNIMVALKKDQEDTSSENQVGDKIYWSRHEKCKEFIERYAVTEGKNMIRVGSARDGDENWRATGGKGGDQRQLEVPDYYGEVSMQEWYLHTKGWYVIRANDSSVREKIAYAMEAACNNKHLGYSQDTRFTAQDWCKYYNNGNYDPAAITVDVNVDCSSLVRLCVTYAGISVGDMYTSNMVTVLRNTGHFTVIDDTAITNSSDYQLRGDILVTRTKGHTVVVLDNGAKASEKKEEWLAIGTAICTKNDTLVYNAPNGKMIRKANAGNRFEIDGKVESGWAHIKIAGMIGWMEEKYIDYERKPKEEEKVIGTGVAKQTMNVRNASNVDGAVVGYVQKGHSVNIIEQLSNGWLKIVWGRDSKSVAYVSNRNNAYFDVTITRKKVQYKVKTNLNIRSGPGAIYTIRGILYQGEVVELSAINGDWGTLKDGRGYCNIKYLEKFEI